MYYPIGLNCYLIKARFKPMGSCAQLPEELWMLKTVSSGLLMTEKPIPVVSSASCRKN